MKQFKILGGPSVFKEQEETRTLTSYTIQKPRLTIVIAQLTFFGAHHGWHPTVNLQ